MNYEKLIDEETWAFIRRTDELLPSEDPPAPLTERRRLYDAWSNEFRARRPSGVDTEDRDANGVPVRVYTVGQPTCTVLFCHGGGFVFGGLNSHDDICAEIAAHTGYRVVAVDYRLAPEYPHPAAFEDCWQALTWTQSSFQGGVVLFGDSAGANLCAALAHKARSSMAELLGQVLVYPLLGKVSDTPSYQEHMSAPMLTRADLLQMQQLRQMGNGESADASFAPLEDLDFADLVPTVAFSADCDPLRDDARLYVEKLLAAGGKAHWVNEAGLVHSYLRARHEVRRAGESFERITLAVEALGQGIWSWD
ncbi:alpha/beta hydrolase fold domain-containing protein [Epibacterium sp. SM1979]|uniref:Alpha/beta hydrolase fold domain-containing protein n=1 Tax=Tritonibacter litoralis TaxID=2662264 RepID=A0A843YE42_9RHOB|nr:alpha/beta hydrolase fold domain-containing protein [Tritonibacter litoralis]